MLSIAARPVLDQQMRANPRSGRMSLGVLSSDMHGKECDLYEIRRMFTKSGLCSVIHSCYLQSVILYLLSTPSAFAVVNRSMKSPIDSETYIYSTHRHQFIHDPAIHSTSGWLAEHGCSRSCISSPIRRLCRSNYVSVVHKPVATCYPNSLDSYFPWHDPLPLLQFKNKACRGRGSSSVRVQLWSWL
jgi:hypothetical protein